jgi:hypothetical protein
MNTNDNTEWFEIGGRFSDYPNYKVSKDGRVRTYGRKPRVLKPTLHHHDYYVVSLVNTPKCLKIQGHVHQLVATAFLGDPPSKDHVVNHKDGNKHNNNVDNLEYVTVYENSVHAQNMGLYKIGIQSGCNKLDEHQIIDVKCLLRLGVQTKQIAKEYKVSEYCIYAIKSGKTWKHIQFGDTL